MLVPSMLPRLPMKRARPVEVIQCPEFPPSSRSSAAGPVRDNKNRQIQEDEDRQQDRKKFQAMYREVMELGASGLAGLDKRRYDARRIVELGGKAPAAQKVPYKMLKGVRAKQKQREAQRTQEARESGLVVARKRPIIPRGKDRQGKKARIEGAAPYPTIGKMRGGTLFLNKDTIAAGRSAGGGGDSRDKTRGSGR